MPAELHRSGFPGIAASAIAMGQAVTESGASQAQPADRRFIPLATSNVRPAGVALASAPNPLDAFPVMDEGNLINITAGASLAAGAEIGVASTNGALGPVAAASGAVVYSIGQARSNAAAAEDFSLYVNPRQLSGLA